MSKGMCVLARRRASAESYRRIAVGCLTVLGPKQMQLYVEMEKAYLRCVRNTDAHSVPPLHSSFASFKLFYFFFFFLLQCVCFSDSPNTVLTDHSSALYWKKKEEKLTELPKLPIQFSTMNILSFLVPCVGSQGYRWRSTPPPPHLFWCFLESYFFFFFDVRFNKSHFVLGSTVPRLLQKTSPTNEWIQQNSTWTWSWTFSSGETHGGFIPETSRRSAGVTGSTVSTELSESSRFVFRAVHIYSPSFLYLRSCGDNLGLVSTPTLLVPEAIILRRT